MRNTLVRVNCILFILLFFTGAVYAESIVIAIGSQPPLFSQSGGLIDQTVRLAFSAEGADVEFEWLPVGRMLTLLQQDSLDVYITPSNTPGQQNPHIDLLEASGVFFYMKDRFPDLKVTSLKDLAGKRVATVVNSPLTPIFEDAGIIVDEGPLEALFTKLELGRVDFASTADVGGILAIRQQFPGREDEFDFTDFSYSNISAGLYVKNKPELIEVLNTLQRGFAKIKSDGTLNEFLQEFFGPRLWMRVKIL